jgi:hypothetical protein
MNVTLTASAPVAASQTTSRNTWWALTGFSAGLLLIHLAAGLVDTRDLGGHDVWLKPAKFSLSFVVLFATIAAVVDRLSVTAQASRTMRWTLVAMTAAFVFEMAYITFQAGRGVHSHFNVGTPSGALMYSLMGVGAVTLVVCVGCLGGLAWRDHSARSGLSLRMGIGLGFLLSMVLTLAVAGYLSSQGSHFVGMHPENGAVVPLMGWSRVVGDLRPAHFLALHAMQALPVLGWWLDRRGVARAHTLIWLAGAAYAALTVAVFVQALMKLPLIPA